jgi:hypothetical protein
MWIVPAGAKTIRIIREGGNGDGYAYINEFSGWEGSDDVLSCRDPGTKVCEWKQQPQQGRLIPYANQQILNGVLNGQYDLLENGIYYHVTWTAVDFFNCTIEETQTPSSIS